jgi:hypothetical protein
MSIIADYLREQSQQHPGLRLYNELCNRCEGCRSQGKIPQLALIGQEVLQQVEDYLTQVNGRSMSLREAGFGGGVPYAIDEKNPRRLSILVEG